jgi:hypothetical protein
VRSCGWIGISRIFSPLAEDPQDALACGQAHVVDVEAGDLGDPGAGVERDERDRAIAWRRALLDFA